MALKAENIYYLVLYTERLSTIVLYSLRNLSF